MARPSTAAVRLTTGEREPCRLATTANITLSGLQAIDGVLTEVGDRVLVKNQTDQTENGIYTASAGEWYRAADARTARNMQKGTTVHIQQGSTNESNVYSFQTYQPNIGEDNIVLAFYTSDDTLGDVNDAVAAGLVSIGAAGDAELADISAAGAAQLDAIAEAGADVTAIRAGDTDASGFGFVNSAGPLADSDSTLPAESVVKDYADTKMPLVGATLAEASIINVDTHRFEIRKDSSPLNYNGTRASFVIQHRDEAAGGDNTLNPAEVHQFHYTGDGVVDAGLGVSTTIWTGCWSFARKEGDGSGHNFTASGELGPVGATGYNEFGMFQGSATNLGSINGTMSGVEVRLADGSSGTNYNTAMHAVIGRIARYNNGAKHVSCFYASSEGTVGPNSVLSTNPQGLATWARGIDFTEATFTTGQGLTLANNQSMAWQNLAGSAFALTFLSTADELWTTTSGTGNAINFGNSALGKSFVIQNVASQVNQLKVTGAATGSAPSLAAQGTDTNIDLTLAPKGTGNIRFGTWTSNADAAVNGYVTIKDAAGNTRKLATIA